MVDVNLAVLPLQPQSAAVIDAAASPAPLAYMANCTHATNFRAAMKHPQNSSAFCRERIIGLFANTASLSPEELDNNPELVEEEPIHIGEDVASLYAEFGMKILGGCCGTDERHIGELAKQLSSRSDIPPC